MEVRTRRRAEGARRAAQGEQDQVLDLALAHRAFVVRPPAPRDDRIFESSATSAQVPLGASNSCRDSCHVLYDTTKTDTRKHTPLRANLCAFLMPESARPELALPRVPRLALLVVHLERARCCERVECEV